MKKIPCKIYPQSYKSKSSELYRKLMFKEIYKNFDQFEKVHAKVQAQKEVQQQLEEL